LSLHKKGKKTFYTDQTLPFSPCFISRSHAWITSNNRLKKYILTESNESDSLT
jgi:hypothetical protein